MDLNHLHLHVRDVERSKRFYTAFFGFAEKVRHGDILFLRNDSGFDLALAPAESVDALPDWFHFGFRLGSRDDVASLHGRLSAEEGARVGPLRDFGDRVTFHCQDPDGYAIETYWE